MSAPFAKLFDTACGQLLAFLDDDNTEQSEIRVVGACVRGVQPSAKLGYDNEVDRQRNFDKMDQAGAEQMAQSLFAAADSLAQRGEQ